MSSTTPTMTGEFATTDPDVAHEWLQVVYADYQPEESNSHRDFRFRGMHAQLGRSGVSRLHYSMSADNNVESSDVLLVFEPSHGVMKVSRGRDEEVVPPGVPVLFPPHQAVSALWADADADCVCLRATDVERIAVETTGIETTALRFTGLRPMSPSLGRHWNDAVRQLIGSVLRHPDVSANPLIAGQLTQLLAAAALDTFPSTRLASHPRVPPGYATPAVVRRAVTFIEANADRETTLSEIAAASGMGARGLQAAFLRHRDTTPTAYARRVRMERAHRDLQAADPAGRDTVPAIAARWGFADSSRFAGEYQQTYHRPPSQTLQS
ncbi:MAG: AraC-type DNA-binding protein [Modestobacter sp.]|jgi:AraC-like DNA-binding protein|nr:AraC-type DNA-binding protein [Modestobacter sp.]